MARIFPHPGHDHERCTASVLSHAESLCAEKARRLTPMRRRVLEILAGSHHPLGAYDIIERLEGARPAPMTVYRALDFLVENGLVHRIESRNAFLACAHPHAAGALVVFFICERCGAAGEATAADVATSLAAAAKRAGFTPKTPVIEVTGICGHCQSAR